MNTLRDASRRLDTDSRVGLCSVVSVRDAGEVLNSMIGRDVCPTAEEAAFIARNLIGLYPAREVGDAKAYAAGMTAVMAAHPIDFVRRVCDPVKGLPSRLRWLPTIADVTEAIEAERKRRDRIAANARYVIAESEQRAQKAREDAESERNRSSAEERARIVAEAIAKFGTSNSSEKAA